MEHLSTVFVLSLSAVNLWGLTLLTGLAFPNRWIALSLGPWLMTTLFFGVETYVGLGSLRGLGLVFTAVSIALIWMSAKEDRAAKAVAGVRALFAPWRAEFAPQHLLPSGLVFGSLFSYAFLWRAAFPDINGSSEKIADLAFISAYMNGDKIPVVDPWLHPYLSVHYYSFQHYAAALYGRLLGLDPGTTYNLGFCLVVAFAGSSFVGAVCLLTRKHWARFLLPALFVFGGSGTSWVVHLTEMTVSPWRGMRFIGSAVLDRTPWGTWLNEVVGAWRVLDMPGEPFSYSIYLGDYHAPLSGFYFLGLAVIAIASWHIAKLHRYVFVAGATLTWCVLSNSWILPLHLAALGAWWIFAGRDHRPKGWMLVAGAGIVWLIAFPYLRLFCSAASSYQVSLRLVPEGLHTPWLLWVLFLSPTLAIAAGGLLSGNRVTRYAAVVTILLLGFAELVFVDDIYSGRFERFNTTLKWWPWIASATLLVGGSLLAEHGKTKWVIVLVGAFCLPSLVFTWDLARAWWLTPKPSLGAIDGTAYLKRDLFTRLMMERLVSLPAGVVIERPKFESFSNSACVPLFTGHRMWLGWLSHEQLWRGYRPDLAQRHEQLLKFFDGDLEKSDDWLESRGIDYVLWYQNADDAVMWERLNRHLNRYIWEEIYQRPDGKRVGLWRLRPSME